MGKYHGVYANKKKSGRSLAFLLGTLAVLCIFSGVLASYLLINRFNDNQAAADRFYFTTDLLGDTNETEELSRQIHLYGGYDNSLYFTVQNYFDDLRITADPITYSVTLSGYDAATVTNSGTQTLAGGVPSSLSHKVTIPAGYTEGQIIAVRITSSSPYQKELLIELVTHSAPAALSYYIEDASGSPYATLYLLSGDPLPAQCLEVVLPNSAENALQPDMTNEYLLDDGGVSHTVNAPTAGSWLKSFTVTKEMHANGSIAIVLYKLYPEKDYSAGSLELPTPLSDTDGKYTLTVPAK